VGLEALRALREAADLFGLNAGDLRDIFHDNAMRLFGGIEEAGTVTQDLYTYAKQRIPGGTQLLSKRPELFAPGCWPAYSREAKGCEVWDLDGNHYYDMSINGVGTCLLGFRDPDVTRAVVDVVESGSMSTLNPPEEVELADRLCAIHPWADEVRFARTGGEICAIAVRIARATTGRSGVAVCGYHGWHDWYSAANLGDDDALDTHLLPGLEPAGIPPALRGTVTTFHYNDLDSFKKAVDTLGNDFAAVVMEPCRYVPPNDGFLEQVRNIANKAGALLVFDEITVGWRLHHGGVHWMFGVEPDLAVFAKAMGNGHPIAAVIGNRAAMEGAHRAFISSTYWTERVGPAAALATIEKLDRVGAVEQIANAGSRVKEIWSQAADEHGLPIRVEGFDGLPHFVMDHPDARALSTLFVQQMLERGFLASTGFYPTVVHNEGIIERYADAVDEVFSLMASAIADDSIKQQLRGPEAQPPFARRD
jgi:glutamate-1-semialdehyde 2,1-aminomutase